MHIQKFLLVMLVISFTAATAGATEKTDKLQTRCGWFDNPTPGNAWLHDRDGEWVVGIQGGHQAEGDWPDFKPSQWVRTNNYYGYGCACITGVANEKTREIVSIASAHARPLSACRNDRAIRKPAFLNPN